MSALLRVRAGLLVAMLVVVALGAGDAFARVEPWLVVAPLVTGLVAVRLAERRWPVRLAGHAAATAASTLAVAVLVGGTARDAGVAATSGARRLLSTDWPSPERPDLLATVALLLALTPVVAVELARRRRLHLAPLAPVVALEVALVGLASPGGPRLGPVAALGVGAVAFASLRPGPGADLRERVALLAGERRLLPIAALALGTAALVAATIDLGGRADPRRDPVPDRSAALVDPVESARALRELDPPVELHDVRITRGDVPDRWRTAALDGYDGVRWAPAATLREIGTRLDRDGDGERIEAEVSFRDADLRLVPLPGAPIRVDAPIETDADRTVVRLLSRPVPGQTVSISAAADPTVADVDPGSFGVSEIDPGEAALSDLAERLVAEGGLDPTGASVLDRLQALERVLRDDYDLTRDQPVGGLQRRFVELFLQETRLGDDEQFATAFVLLARSLGAQARLAIGFTDPGPDARRPDGDAVLVTLSSADAAVWPEVRVGDRWLAFDPVPERETTELTPPEPEPQLQTPAAPQPPLPPPPDGDDDPVERDDADDGSDRALPLVVAWALRGAAALGAVAAPIALVVGAILGVKRRRRRRWLRGEPVQRIRGAWRVATARLVDDGLDIAPSSTNDEIASDASDHVGGAVRDVRRLASLASASTFGSPARPDLLAEDARACLERVEAALDADRTRRERLRRDLSLRSLRSRTATPV